MPTDSSGNYSLPAIYVATPGTDILSDQHNTPLEDVAAALSARLPRNGSAPMTGPLTLAGAPTLDLQAATKKYVDDTGVSVAALIPAVQPITWTDVASAATTDLGAQASDRLRITGTVAITGFGTAASGVSRKLRFAGALVLTHNATSLILPGGASITTAAGDTAEAISLGSGNWIVFNYQKANGQAVVSPSISGRVGQMQVLRIPTAISCPTTVPYDNTKPQTGEMTLVGAQAFTPQNAASTLVIECIIYGTGSASSTYAIVGIFEGSDTDPLGVGTVQNPNNSMMAIPIKIVVPASDTTARNYLIKVGVDAGTGGSFTVNGQSGSLIYGGALASFLSITEILP